MHMKIAQSCLLSAQSFLLARYHTWPYFCERKKKTQRMGHNSATTQKGWVSRWQFSFWWKFGIITQQKQEGELGNSERERERESEGKNPKRRKIILREDISQAVLPIWTLWPQMVWEKCLLWLLKRIMSTFRKYSVFKNLVAFRRSTRLTEEESTDGEKMLNVWGVNFIKLSESYYM